MEKEGYEVTWTDTRKRGAKQRVDGRSAKQRCRKALKKLTMGQKLTADTHS